MWVQIALFVASLVISSLMRSKVPTNQPTPGTLSVTAIAAAGVEIPVLFGSREITGQNIVWYGHLRTSAIKKSGGKK